MAWIFTCQSKRNLLQLTDLLPSLYTPPELSFASNNLLSLRIYPIWDWPYLLYRRWHLISELGVDFERP
jgi:hypothetical protein